MKGSICYSPLFPNLRSISIIASLGSIVDRLRLLSTEQLEQLGEDFLGFVELANLIDWLDRSSQSIKRY